MGSSMMYTALIRVFALCHMRAGDIAACFFPRYEFDEELMGRIAEFYDGYCGKF